VVNVGQRNPFDFSDFGPSTTPPQARAGAQPPAPSSGGFSTGFDPWTNEPKTPQRRQDTFGTATTTGTLETAGPPLKWFAVALLLAVAGAALALLSATSGGGVFATALAGWLLAGPLAIGALAMYSRVDIRRRSESIYSAPRWAATLYWAVLVVCLVGIALGAWQIALWAGRQ
jgi:hypothetical protein